MSDEELMLAFARSPSAELFAEITGRFSGLLHHAVWKILRDEHDAADASQDALLLIWKYGSNFAGTPKASVWIYTVAKNAALSQLRRRKAKRRDCLENVPKFVLDQCPQKDDQPTPDEEDAALLRAALANLPDTYRAVVTIVDLEERPYEDAAAELQIPIGTVRSRRHRALALLREFMPDPTPIS